MPTMDGLIDEKSFKEAVLACGQTGGCCRNWYCERVFVRGSWRALFLSCKTTKDKKSIFSCLLSPVSCLLSPVSCLLLLLSSLSIDYEFPGVIQLFESPLQRCKPIPILPFWNDHFRRWQIVSGVAENIHIVFLHYCHFPSREPGQPSQNDRCRMVQRRLLVIVNHSSIPWLLEYLVICTVVFVHGLLQ